MSQEHREKEKGCGFRVYIHTTIHILNSIVSKYVSDSLPQKIGGIETTEIYTHDFRLSRVER